MAGIGGFPGYHVQTHTRNCTFVLPSGQERETLTGVHCDPLCWCGNITKDGTNMSKRAFLPVPFLLSHRLGKWKAGSRTPLENSQKNPRILNTMHRLLLSRTLSRVGVARVSSSFEDSFPLLVSRKNG